MKLSTAESILTWSYNLAGMMADDLPNRLPQVLCYQNHSKLGDICQFALIVGALLRIERYLGDADYRPLHESILTGIAPEMRKMYVGAMRNLVAFLTATREELLDAKPAIPLLDALHDADEEFLMASFGSWSVWNLKGAQPAYNEDGKTVSVMGRLIYTSTAKIIASMELSSHNPHERMV